MTIKQILSRSAARLAVTAMVVLSAATISATSAQAAADGPIVHEQSDLCLDGSVSQGVRLNKCNGSAYQNWIVNGYYLRNDATELCLDGSVSQGVRLNTCNYTTYQQWDYATGYKLEHRKSELCLDGSVSQGVRLNTCNFSTYQNWAVYGA